MGHSPIPKPPAGGSRRPSSCFRGSREPFNFLLNVSARLVLRFLGIKSSNPELDRVHSPEEIRMLVQQSRKTGGLGAGDARLLEGVFEFSEKNARDVIDATHADGSHCPPRRRSPRPPTVSPPRAVALSGHGRIARRRVGIVHPRTSCAGYCPAPKPPCRTSRGPPSSSRHPGSGRRPGGHETPEGASRHRAR